VAPIHADESDGPIAAECGGISERAFEKCRESLSRHLPGAHGELPVPDAAAPTHIPIDWDIIRGVSEDEIGTFLLEQLIEGRKRTRIPAQQAMTTQVP